MPDSSPRSSSHRDPVTVVSAARFGEGASSLWAQAGIAAALAEGDSPEDHAADTITAGAGIVDEKIALLLAREARERVEDLLRYGVPFDKDLEGHLTFSREAAHGKSRILHVKGDTAGRAIMHALMAAVRATPSITVLEGLAARDLILRDGRVAGLEVAPTDGGHSRAPLHLAGERGRARDRRSRARSMRSPPIHARRAARASPSRRVPGR